MSSICIYPKCRIGQKDGERKVTFEIPKEKDLLAEWLEKIPFVNFGTIDIKTAALCIDHFKKSDYSVKNKSYKLKSGAVPSVFEKPQFSELTDCCRFCLKLLGSNRNRVQISEATREYFQSITSQELKISKDFSEFTCKQCESKITEFFIYRNTLLNIQEMWYQSFNQFNEFIPIKEETKDPIFGNFPIKLEDSQEQESSLPSFKNFDDFEDELNHPLFEMEFSEELKAVEKIAEPKIKRRTRKIVKARRVSRYIKKSNGPYICDICGREFKLLLCLKNHMQTHLLKEYICKYQNCGMKFETASKFRYHKKRFHYKMKENFVCNRPECEGLTFDAFHKLDRHKKNIHYKKNDVVCHLCGKSYAKPRFEDHFRAVHTSERPFICDYPNCQKTFSISDNLKHHIRVVHVEKPPVQCNICSKYFKPSTIQKHMLYHVGEIFTCDIDDCGKQFVNKSVLNQHKKIHFNQKDYVCQYKGCSARYHNGVGLRKHIYSLHMRVRIPCEVPGCKSQLTRKEVYRSHVLSMHKDLEESVLNALLLKIRKMKLPKVQYTEEKSQETSSLG